MIKKIATVVILILLLVYGVYLYSSITENRAFERDTVLYLENEGYDIDTDIAEMNRVNIGQTTSQNAMVVTFENKPDTVFFYTYRENSEEIFLLDSLDTVNE